MDAFDALIAEAGRRPLVGWDLSLDGRIVSGPPWDYTALVDTEARAAPDLLDIGAGGGEWLAGLPHRPARTVAVEGWPPNVPVARRRLEPLGVSVLAFEGAPDNVAPSGPGGALPFPDADFALITCRHEAYRPEEIARVLAPGGVFLTQQVGAGVADDLYALFDVAPPPVPVAWTLALAVRQLEAAGLAVDDALEGHEVMTFADVVALAWYLTHVPFVFDDFEITAHRDRLEALHRAGAPITIRQPLFRLRARHGSNGP